MVRDYVESLFVSEQELSDMLNALPSDDPTAASDFFVRFGLAQLYGQGAFFQALERGHKILHLLNQLNSEKYSEIHKGYIFYFMGMAAYRLHDFQSAIYYIDATLSEDRKNFPEDPDTPPHLFLRLEGENERQAAQALTGGAQETIEEYLRLYNNVLEENQLGIDPLLIEEVREFFLGPSVAEDMASKRSLASTFITFFLEFKYRDFQLRLRREPGTNEPLIFHLYKGCLLYESLLKNNPKVKVDTRTLRPTLNLLSNEMQLTFNNGIDIRAETLDDALQEAVAGTDELTSSVIITGKLRNTLSHNLGWPSEISPEQYLHGFLQISISCLHAIATLYRNK